MSGNGISWTLCKSAPRSRQITMPAPHHSVFYRPDALPAAQPTASKHWRRTTCYHKLWTKWPGSTDHRGPCGPDPRNGVGCMQPINNSIWSTLLRILEISNGQSEQRSTQWYEESRHNIMHSAKKDHIFTSIIQTMHGSKWILKYDEPEVEMSHEGCALVRHISMSHKRPCSICFFVWPTTSLKWCIVFWE